MSKALETRIYHRPIMEEHKKKLILERLEELEVLKKRIKYLEQELTGMGANDFNQSYQKQGV